MSVRIRASVEWDTASRQWSVSAAELPSVLIFTRRFGECAVAARSTLATVTGDDVEADLYIGGHVVRGDPPLGDSGDQPRTESPPPSERLATVLGQASDEEVLDQGERWTDSAGQVHAIAEMTTAHLANTVLYLDRTAVDRLVWWYVAHELAGDEVPVSLLDLARASRAEVVELMRSLVLYEAVENELAHRLGAPRTDREPIAWLGAGSASRDEAKRAWSKRYPAPQRTSLFDVAWHVRRPGATKLP